jgi:hypothetical protein
MVRGWLLGLGAPLVVAALGCKPACDEAELRRAAAAFSVGSDEEREAGIQALEQACPTLPSSLGWGLRAEHGELPDGQRLAVRMDQAEDSLWMELLLRTCPRAEEPIERGVTQAEHDRAMRERCDLDRYGLLATSEPYTMRDLQAFMLYEWLVSQRVDEALARELTQPLLTAHATLARREVLCLRGDVPCDGVLDAWGLRAARSTGDLRVTAAPTLHITRSAISFEGTPVIPLESGRPSPDAFVDHVAPALLERLRTLPGSRPGPAVLGSPRDAHLVVAADEATPFSTLVDIAFTANQAGLPTLELVARHDDGLVGLPLTVPIEWLEVPEGRHIDRDLSLVFIVHPDRVEVGTSGWMSTKRFDALASCEPSLAGCHDHEAIGAYATQIKSLFPHETVASFRVHGDVPVQTFVSLLDTVRGGADCSLSNAMAGGPIPDACLFWQPILDLEPPVVPPAERGSHEEGDRG